MKVTLRQLQEGEKQNLKDCLKMEYRLTQRFMVCDRKYTVLTTETLYKRKSEFMSLCSPGLYCFQLLKVHDISGCMLLTLFFSLD